MKKVGFFIAGLILLSLSWIGFVREPLPPIPQIAADVSEEVALDFSINSMNKTGIELAMNEKVKGEGMYVQFRMADVFETGRLGLVLYGIKTTSDFKNGVSPKGYMKSEKPAAVNKKGKDLTIFMKDKQGKDISNYSFSQKLVKGKDGQTYMQMTYNGPAVEMLQTLEVARPITLPAPISRKFLPKGIIQFMPGTVALDPKIKGFYIPVAIKG
ncbi:MAG: hypothetical protein R3E32_18640 [Chitinophagales bacterium]